MKLFIHVAFYNTSLENFKSRDESGPLRVKLGWIDKQWNKTAMYVGQFSILHVSKEQKREMKHHFLG